MLTPAPAPAIRLRGVRHNNLKNFDLELPLHRLIVITGLSGSGKSSLAFDTLYAEGQRRYIETFSPYARQFFDRMDKPQVDSIEGIPPAIAIEQRNAVRSTRSTVGTMTEICDYMKVLWPHVARLHCRGCGQPVRKETPQKIWETIQSSTFSSSSSTRLGKQIEDENKGGGREFLITFNLPLSEKLSLAESLALVSKQGYQRLLLEGEIVRLEDAALRAPRIDLTVVQDRLRLSSARRARFVEACEQAYHFGKGKLTLHELDATRPLRSFSNRLHCAACDLEYPEPSPALFSFNHPLGACPACKGFGRTITIDYHLALPDRALTLAQGAVKPWRTGTGAESQKDLTRFCKTRGVPMNVPFAALSAEHQRWIIEGDADYGRDENHQWPRAWYGVKGYFRWMETKSYKMHVRVLLSRYRAYTKCAACDGTRLKSDALLYRLHGAPALRRAPLSKRGTSETGVTPSLITLADVYALPVRAALELVTGLAQEGKFSSKDPVAHAFKEVQARLGYLNEVGLGYLTLDRATRTLSGGETERVNLTTCLGTRLVNTLFVLDEPSVGLHPRDTDRLVRILEKLRDTGNTVVVVEHEVGVMRAADQIVDIGPGHGATGGEVVFQGSLPEILQAAESLTGQYLSGRKQIEIPSRRPVAKSKVEYRMRKGIAALEPAGALRALSLQDADFTLASSGAIRPSDAKWLTIANASRHNLKSLSVAIPLNRFVALTGVSGSGKSTLIRDVLLPALADKLNGQQAAGGDQQTDGTEFEGADNSPTSELRPPPTALTGFESLGQVVLVDQSALGKTPRSNPAVYIGAFDDIREVFAQSEAARQRGLNASAFSFNSGVGQCERCRGAGFEKIEMQFLSDIFIRCPDCAGRRYRPHILEVKICSHRPGEAHSLSRNDQSLVTAAATNQEWSIGDLLEATVDEVIAFLETLIESKSAFRAIASLKLLQEVGLGYLRLGQPINTLSGGESQRLKLVRHLAAAVESRAPSVKDGATKRSSSPRPSTLDPRPTLFLFDEPTTGLHFDDVRVLLKVFQRLVDAGHSVLVIEHNLDVIKCADWVIDLGPEAGDRGGQIVAQGMPETVALSAASHTGRFLRKMFETRSAASRDRIRQVNQAVERVPAANGITIAGAREHNLKNLSLEIPRNQFVVITGVSGSGKSTLAFDLLFAEGQRRFLDSMNVYARQFVEQLSRPDVDLITGIPPTVSIEQRTSRGGGKSTVATVTEIYHFIRLLFARLGLQHCPDCHLPVQAQTRDELAKQLRAEFDQRGPLRLFAPMVRNRKGFHSDVAAWAAKHGFAEIRADGKMFATSKAFRLDRFREHDVEIAVGVLEFGGPRSRDRGKRNRSPEDGTPDPQKLIEQTLELGHGTLFAEDTRQRLTVHSTERACPKCTRSFEPLDPKNFSYNSSQGWCPKCRGFGELFYLPDVERGANADAVEESWWSWAQEREVCPECNGARLNPIARAVRLKAGESRRGLRSAPRRAPTIVDVSALDVAAALKFMRALKFTGREAEIARDILPEISERLKFLHEVGLGYLQLGRGAPTLSGGESQRIRLAAQLGSNLSGVLYVLDEPTIGLHARDNEQLLAVLEKLRARGNSIVVVEHDEETMRRADHIIDLGPGAGIHGGQVVAAGTLAELARHPESVTGRCLRAEKKFPARGARRPVLEAADVRRIKSKSNRSQSLLTSAATGSWLTLRGATTNNLKNLTVQIPLGRLVLVTGVSGSGKSTLIRECLLPELQAVLANKSPAQSARLAGHQALKAVYEVDQAPIGRTPRSIPATYVGFFDDIRALFAQVPEARIRGYSASRFSFNSAQGRCPECEGAGQIKLEMNFLPPAFVRCETCDQTRFNRETLDIEYGGKNIAQVLDLSVEAALEFFAGIPKIKRALQALHDTGLDYLKLGQPSPTLSGGEAQRVKLVSHLLTGLREARVIPPPRPDGHPLPSGWGEGRGEGRTTKRNLFILEEPTIGLHLADVRRLVEVLQRLVDAGHSVVVIEHNLDLIAEADWVLDLGPEGGAGGGQVVAVGTPETVAQNKQSHTGRFLRKLLAKS